jgi:hypothetical protein
MELAEVEEEVHHAAALMEDEGVHQRSAATHQQSFQSGGRSSCLSDADIKVLREKHIFLCDFSDAFIRNTSIGDLMRIESTAMKARELERAKDADDKLAMNKIALATTYTSVQAGQDNRWNCLHEGRFLGGAACSTTKLWLTAKQHMGSSFAPPVGNYDMGSVGLAGYVSSKGWAELANPASTKLSVKMFNINSCTSRSSSKKSDQEDEFLDVSEFKLALRVLRTAMAFAMPWNFSILALEGFFYQTNFCGQDLTNVEKKANVLSRFTDYVISQNGDRWRDGEPFITAGELKAVWAAFFGAQPQVSAAKKNGQKQGNQKHGAKTQDPRLALGVCFAWNLGQCLKPAGTCTTSKGRPLKHVCDYAADPAKPTDICGKDHIRKDFHK